MSPEDARHKTFPSGFPRFDVREIHVSRTGVQLETMGRERKEGPSGRIGGVVPVCVREKGRRREGKRRRRIEMSRGETESSGTTCANYFARQFLAVVAGVAKSFDRYDTGSIRVVTISRYNGFYSNVAVSGVADTSDRWIDAHGTTNCLSQLFRSAFPTKKKKKTKIEKVGI